MCPSLTQSPDLAAVGLPAPAATVLLLRDAPGGVEVLLQRRRQSLRFMGGKWVFPGGRQDPADADPRMLGRITTADRDRCAGRLQALDGSLLSAPQALAAHVAACRETYEEVGILLARDRTGRPVPPVTVLQLQGSRAAVAAAPAGFARVLAAEGLQLDIDRLVYWAHWITPSAEPARRFDTRFFAIGVPADQAASCDGGETTESLWVTPVAALEASARGDLALVPPTLLTLEDLAECARQHGRVEPILAAESGRQVPPILPRVDRRHTAPRVLMPWHEDYASAEGAGVVATASWPAHLLRRRASLVLRPDFGVVGDGGGRNDSAGR